MAAPEPRSVVAWLDTVKRGYGKRYSKYFDEMGIEDEEDVRRMRPARVDELREILAKANVKPVQHCRRHPFSQPPLSTELYQPALEFSWRHARGLLPVPKELQFLHALLSIGVGS